MHTIAISLSGKLLATYSKFQKTQKHLFFSPFPFKNVFLTFAFVIGAMVLSPNQSFAQINGVKTIPGDYATFTLAVAALNSQGVGIGGVTFDIAAGHTELGVKATLRIPNNPPNAYRPLVFRKAGVGANPLFTAGNGNTATKDCIVKLVGIDYVTFDGIDLQEKPSPVSFGPGMEFGYALLKTDPNNGSQHITIKNCHVSLDKANPNTVGIYAAHADTNNLAMQPLTQIEGTHSYNQFLSNTIENCYIGYWLVGYRNFSPPFDLHDQGNDIGIDAQSNLPSRVMNFGGGTSAAHGILMEFQNLATVTRTKINSNGGTTSTGPISGITFLGFHGNYDVLSDSVTLSSSGTSADAKGIDVNFPSSNLGVVNIVDNIVENCTYTSSTSGSIVPIACGGGDEINILNNQVKNNTIGGNGYIRCFRIMGRGGVHVIGNLIQSNTGLNSGKIEGITVTNSTHSLEIASNQIYNNVSGGSGFGIFVQAYGNQNCHNNSIHDNSSGLGAYTGISASGYAEYGYVRTYSENEIYNISGATTVSGAQFDFFGNLLIEKNRIYNLVLNGGYRVAGIIFGSNHNLDVHISNNFISQLYASTIQPNPSIIGLEVNGFYGSSFEVDHNTIYLDGSNTSTTLNTYGIRISGLILGATLRNNIVVNLIPPGTSSGFSSCVYGTQEFGELTNSNCFFIGNSPVSRLQIIAGNGAPISIQEYRDWVAPHDQAAISEMPPFVNVTTPPYDLHLQNNVVTGCESGGTPVSPIADDFDGDIRYDLPGYPANAYTTVACDIGADEFAGIPLDLAPPVISFPSIGNGVVAPSRMLINWATITDASGIDTLLGSRPRIYYKKSTHANAFVDNTSSTNGWKYSEAINNTSPFSFQIDYTRLFGGNVTNANKIEYFVVAQDLDTTRLVGKNVADFAIHPDSVNLNASNFPIPIIANSKSFYVYTNSFSDTINVGPGQAYTTLTGNTGLFNAINNASLSGNLVVQITGDLLLETGSRPLYQWSETGIGGYSLKIIPNSNTLRTITGNGLIRLEGADRVTIDGRFNGSGRYLLFRQQATNAPAIVLKSDAQENIIRNCILEAGNQNAGGEMGGVISIGQTFYVPNMHGNDYNTILECEIRDRSDIVSRPKVGINAYGSSYNTQVWNDHCVIKNNIIHDIWVDGNSNNVGILITDGNTIFQIDSNSIYQTMPRTATIGQTKMRGIEIANANQELDGPGFSVRNNFIGGTGPYCSGSPLILNVSGSFVSGFYGISLSSRIWNNLVSGNQIRNMHIQTNDFSWMEACFVGIHTNKGSSTISNNLIGGASGVDSITVTTFGTVSPSLIAGIDLENTCRGGAIINNKISQFSVTSSTGLLTKFFPIQALAFDSEDTIVIRGNLIGSDSTLASIAIFPNLNPTELHGIHLGPLLGNYIVDSNQVSNLSSQGTAPNGQLLGIAIGNNLDNDAKIKVSNNLVYGLRGKSLLNGTPFALSGIGILNISKNNLVVGNTIHTIISENVLGGSIIVSGITADIETCAGTILANKIYDLQNLSSTGTPAIQGISIVNGSGWNLVNNMISISNAPNLNPIEIAGIVNSEAEAIVSPKVLYNSVYLGGSQAGGNFFSAGILRNGTAELFSRNNLVYNARSGGTGKHFAISNRLGNIDLNWTPYTSAYNTFIVQNSANMAEWGLGNSQTFAQWKLSTFGDIESYSDTIGNVPTDSLFFNTTNGDLKIVPSNPVCWYVNGKGIAGSISNFTGFDQEGDPRSILLGTPTDIGADEFTPDTLVLPIPAIESAAPSPGTTTSYTFAGRRLGEIIWDSLGILPQSVSWSYFSSVPPPGAPGIDINSYWEITPNGGSGYRYHLNSYYTIHEQNGLADNALRLGRQIAASPWFYFTGNPSSNVAGKYFEKLGLTNFSNCTLGNSPASPPFIINASVISGIGTISPAGAVPVLPLSNQSFSISNGSCSTIDSVFVDSVYVGAINSFDFLTVNSNHTIEVIFDSVIVIPSVTIAANPNSTICPNTPITFTANSTGTGNSPTFQWFNNGMAVGTNDSVLVDSAFINGDQVYCIMTSSDSCAFNLSDSSNTLSIVVMDTTAPIAICQNYTLTLDSNGIGQLIAGMIDNGSYDLCAIDTMLTVPAIFNCSNIGANSVTLTVLDGSGNSDSCTASVTIAPQTLASVMNPGSYACGYNLSCNGAQDGAVQINATGGCPNYAYSWSTGDTSVNISGLAAGTYSVTITDGVSAQIFDSITITEPPLIQISIDSIQGTCDGDSNGTIGISVNGGNSCSPYNYLWSNGSSTEDVTGLLSGSYSISVTDIQGCFLNQTIFIPNHPLPSPTIYQIANTLFATQSWPSYQWNNNGNAIPGATSSTYNLIQSGSYSLTVVDSFGCMGTSDTLNLMYVAIENPFDDAISYAIFPNPISIAGSNHLLEIRVESQSADAIVVQITDLYGKLLITKEFLPLGQPHKIDISGLSAGSYIVELLMPNKQWDRKILIIQ